MEDLLDQLRSDSLARQSQSPSTEGHPSFKAPARSQSAYDHLRWRLNWGLPGSIAILAVVAALAPLYVHRLPYLISYIVVLAIAVMRVMIAVQMFIAIRHLDPTRPVAEVSAYADRMTLLQRFNRRYTLYIKLPVTVCLGPLFGPPFGLDFFSLRWFVIVWLVLCAVLLPLNAWGIIRSFRRLDAAIENIRSEN
ncbi:MAG: hypothetical protein IJ785_08195 [Bacteroidales bacterium]|nr:hypothetical protein [Bacteroidales bacterium]